MLNKAFIKTNKVKKTYTLQKNCIVNNTAAFSHSDYIITDFIDWEKNCTFYKKYVYIIIILLK